MSRFLENGISVPPKHLSPEFGTSLQGIHNAILSSNQATDLATPDPTPGGTQLFFAVASARRELAKLVGALLDVLEEVGDLRLLLNSAATCGEIHRKFPTLSNLPEITAQQVALATRRQEVRATIEIDLDDGRPDRPPRPIDPIGGGRPGLPPGGGPGPGKPIKIRKTSILPGYRGPRLDSDLLSSLNTLREIFEGGSERTFTLGLLCAESRAAKSDFPGAIEEYTKLLSGGLEVEQRRFVAIRCGFAFLGDGDSRFRRSRNLSGADRTATAAVYDEAVTVVAENGVESTNPQRDHIERYAEMQKAKLEAGLNFIGYSDSYVPILRPDTLQERAERRIAQAGDAIRMFEIFQSKADQIQDQLEDLEFEADIKRIEEEIAEERIETAHDQLNIANTRVDQIEEQLNSLDLTSAVGAAGFVLKGVASGFLAGKGGEGGTSLPGVAGALSGFASTAASYFARQEDLRKQRIIARIESGIAVRGVQIAELQREITEATLDFLGDKIQRIQNRELNPDVYYAAAEEFRVLAERHLEAAIHWAFLLERSVAFLRLTDLTNTITFDYLPLVEVDDDGKRLTAADRLAADVADIVDANVPITKFQHLTETYSLRTLHPLEYASFQQSGEMDFTISLYEQNKLRPGVFQQRIKGVTVELVGLIPSTGFTGRLIHHGSFLLRDKDTTPEASEGRFVPTDEQLEEAMETLHHGGSQGVPVDGVMIFVLDEDRLELSADTPPPNIDDPAPEALNIFEGYGPAGHWRLEVANIDLRNVIDVRLGITYVIPESDGDLSDRVEGLLAEYEDELLESELLELQGDALDLISPFSLQRDFPDVMAELPSGEAELALSREDFPSGITDLRLKTVIAQILDEDGAGMEGVEVEIVRAGTSLALARTTREDGFTEDLDDPVPLLPVDQRFLVEGAYTLRLPDADPSVNDLTLFFIYEFREV